MKTLINVHGMDLFLIEFRYKSTDNKFIVSANQIADCLKTYDAHGIKSIKRFDPSKNTFKRVSRAEILNLVSFDTESVLYLENHYFFK
jgi:hypothetical protein